MSGRARVRAGSALDAARARLAEHGPSVLLAALAAAVAYVVAATAFSEHHAFFAPVAAVIIVGLSGGQRLRRSLEVTGGVLVGVLTGELVAMLSLPVSATVAVAIAGAMGLAVALRPTALFTNQAAVAAVVTTILAPLTQAPPFVRLGDAVIGGAVALAVAVPATLRPVRALRRSALAATEQLATSVEHVADVLRDDSADADAAVRAVVSAANSASTLDDAVLRARESVRVGRRARELARGVARTTRLRDEWLELVTSLVAVARAARGMRRGAGVSAGAAPDGTGSDATGDDRLADLVVEVAGAVRDVGHWVAAVQVPDCTGTSDTTEVTDRLRARLARLAEKITDETGASTAPQPQALTLAARSAVVDALRVTGVAHGETVALATQGRLETAG